MEFKKRAASALLGTLVLYAALVGTNEGEFWPFSIYPMFSRGANPWSRAVVRELPASERELDWRAMTAAELPGRPFATLEHGIDPIDLANFVSKTSSWNRGRVDALRKMFAADALDSLALLVLRVNGRITEDDSVEVEFVPYVLMGPDYTRLNGELATAAEAGI